MAYLRVIISLEAEQLSISLVKIPKISDNNHIGRYKCNKNLIVALSASRKEYKRKTNKRKSFSFQILSIHSHTYTFNKTNISINYKAYKY